MFNIKNKNQSIKMSRSLKIFFMWPIYVGIVWIILNLSMFFINIKIAAVMSGFIVIYILGCVFIWLYIKPIITRELIQFSSNYSQVQHHLMYELSVPYCLVDINGKVMWMNKLMLEKTGKKKDFRKNISDIFPEITSNVFPENEQSKEIRIAYEERDYCIEMKRIDINDLTRGTDIIDNNESGSFYAMYMFDETDINMYIQKLKDERFVVGLVYIDNYEEALDSIDDVRRSLFIGLIDKRVNKYFASGASIVRKLEKDKYLIVFTHKFLEKLMNDKFSLLEEIKNVKIGNEMTITLSMGIGTGESDYAKNYEVAKAAMDLALGRGGDQAVVKENDKISYYGGKSQQMEKNTRVKVRVKAHALRQILENNENVLIMGHKLADIDAFGSAMGIFVICRKLGKKAHIVINDITVSVKPFINRFIDKDDYPEDMFLLREEAVDYVDDKTAVIVVDVNKPSLTECPELLDVCKTIVVFDHHRQSSDAINNAVLSYVDPYASSAAEMITEMIQYVDDGVKIRAFEADALYAGISIDTDGFNSKSGPRTFEAAAYLKRNGADLTKVRKMSRESIETYRIRAKAISEAEILYGRFAIATLVGIGVDSPTVIGAQVSNELLDIDGIEASFVLTSVHERVYISARSIDEVNVQKIMEEFGGGGHLTVAGAQLVDVSLDEAKTIIRETLKYLESKGDI